MAGRLHRRHARARLCRDRQDPQQHAAGAKPMRSHLNRGELMIDHIGFPVSRLSALQGLLSEGAGAARLQARDGSHAGADTATIPPPGSAPTESRISGSAAKAAWTSRCMSRSWPRIAPRCDAFYQAAIAAGGARQRRAGIRAHYHPIITALSCSIPMATTSKPSATRGVTVSVCGRWYIAGSRPLSLRKMEQIPGQRQHMPRSRSRRELMKKIGFSMLVTRDVGKLRARPMSADLEQRENNAIVSPDLTRASQG